MMNTQKFHVRISFCNLMSGVVVLILAAAFLLPLCSAQETAAKPSTAGGDKVLAIVNGKAITEQDIRKKSAEQFAQLDREYQSQQRQLLETQLDQAVQESLLDAEAAAKGVSKEQLLAEIKPPDVTDADVDKFYEENKARIPKPKEQVADQIKQYLQQVTQTEVRKTFIKSLEAKYKVEMKLEPMRTEVAATGPAMGPATAPVTIVEFSDFECPYCSRHIPTLEQVKAKYGEKVRLVFRQFPLAMHPNAQKAAEASLCANEQGKFWEMHDAMFKNQKGLAIESLKALAVTLGIQAEQFNSCLDSGKFVEQIKTDVKEGAAAGVSGTPAMFINGRFVNGAVPLEQITNIIDDELRRKGGS